jgi:GTPase SAR1 family protein
VNNWVVETERYVMNGAIPTVIVGNKEDLAEERAVSQDACKKLADELGFYFAETSAKTGEGVEEVFLHLTRLMVAKRKSMPPAGKSKVKALILEPQPTTKKQKKFCAV